MASNPHPLSIDSAIKLLTSTMRDPLRSKVCSERLAIAADRIEQALEACDSVSEKTKLVKSHPELVREGIKFLTFNQSLQDFVTLLDRFAQCRCDFGQKRMRLLHTPSKDRTLSATDPKQILLFDALAIVTQCIILALSGLTKHQFRAGNSSNGQRRWPQGPEDLLPFGPKDSVAGLDLWATGMPSAYFIFDLAGSLALFYTPFGVEVFQYPKFIFSMEHPCQHLETAITFYQEDNSSTLARERCFDSPIKSIFRFFDCLFGINPHQFTVMIMSCGVWLKPILTPLATILSTLPREWSEIRAFVSHITSNVYAEAEPITRIMIAKYDFDLLIEAVGQLDLLEDAFNGMCRARKQGCWNPECPSLTEVVHSRLCGRCSLIRFCGENCQKDAWRYDDMPHKALCAKIYSLKKAFGEANWSLLGTPDFEYAQFQTVCRVKKITTKVVTEIGNELSALIVRRRLFVKHFGLAPEDRLMLRMGETFAGMKVLDSREGYENTSGSRAVTVLSRARASDGGVTRRSLVPAFTNYWTSILRPRFRYDEIDSPRYLADSSL